MDRSRPSPPAWQLFIPKLYTTLRQGYSFAAFRQDAIAGLTVAIVALPLAMALAIASGTTPDKGLITAVIAGFLISALGGSRFQIGGPTGAFVVVVFAVIAEHGYDGLVLATLMAGGMLILAGLFRLGTWIKYIPEPVVIGFTAGIAVIIFSSQIKDIFGLEMAEVPADFLDKLEALWAARASLSPVNLGLSLAALAVILGLRRFAPKLPGFLIAVLLGSVIVTVFHLPVDTIGSRFGALPQGLPTPHWPDVSWARLQALLPSAFTIAFLAGVESLLSAVVADGMTGGRHRSNGELVAQGVANSASALFGGLPATGAIARTATNVRAGARSPVAGMLHAVFLLAFMVIAGSLASYIPLACLAAILIVVAWNMSEIDRIRHLMSGPWGDRLVLVITFALTVLVDLTVAIEVGVVLAAILFMHRMANVVAISTGDTIISRDQTDSATANADQAEAYAQRRNLPAGVEVFALNGPLFFGVVGRVTEVLDRIAEAPKVFILRLDDVPLIDAAGASKLADFIGKYRRQHTAVILCGLQSQPYGVLQRMHILDHVTYVATFDQAITEARTIIDKE